MITKKQYTGLDDAFNYFNQKLFKGELPDVLITLQRKAKTQGYHHFEKFEGREDKKERITEIALNPDTFSERSDAEVLSTLVHEMVHHWQYTFSEPAKRGYHDREWSAKMKEIGLYPSNTGEPEGKETGRSMSHYIMNGGIFEITCGAFLLAGNKIMVDSVVEPKLEKEKKKTREKFVCPSCMQSVQAKKSANIVCGDCMEHMIVEES